MVHHAGKPLASDCAAKRVGQVICASYVIAVDPITHTVVQSCEHLSPNARSTLKGLGNNTGKLSVDGFETPIVVQSLVVLQRIEALARTHGAALAHTVRQVQYFRDLHHFPAYSRVRVLFYPAGVVNRVAEVSRMLTSGDVRIEVGATFDLG